MTKRPVSLSLLIFVAAVAVLAFEASAFRAVYPPRAYAPRGWASRPPARFSGLGRVSEPLKDGIGVLAASTEETKSGQEDLTEVSVDFLVLSLVFLSRLRRFGGVLTRERRQPIQ